MTMKHISEFLPKIYYRLFCKQNNEYMSTGYNSTSINELCDAYSDYKSVDRSDEMTQAWERMSIGQRIQEIGDDEFQIESSPVPFEDR